MHSLRPSTPVAPPPPPPPARPLPIDPQPSKPSDSPSSQVPISRYEFGKRSSNPAREAHRYSLHSMAVLAAMALAVLWSLVGHASLIYAAPLPNQTRESQEVSIALGEPEVLALPGLERVAVGDAEVVSVKTMRTPTGLLLAGRRVGSTSLLVWQRGQDAPRRIKVRVRPESLEARADAIRLALGAHGESSRLRLEVIGDRIVVSGSARDEHEATRISHFAKSDSAVLNMVETSGTEEMLALEVRFLEIKRNALERIGINWQKSIAGPVAAAVGDGKTNGVFRPAATGNLVDGAPEINLNFPGAGSVAAAGKVSPFAVYVGLQTAVLSVINLLEQDGDALVLAEPVLSCRSGGSARFLAGGEIPLPATSALGNTTIQFKPYGIRFEVQPRVNDNGSLSASILTELSTIDPSIRVGDIPAFLSRLTETQIKLNFGETLVMSGLYAEEGSRSEERLALLGRLPILGPLFRSNDFRENRSEMVVFVTPRRMSAASPENQNLVEKSQRDLDAARRRLSGQGDAP